MKALETISQALLGSALIAGVCAMIVIWAFSRTHDPEPANPTEPIEYRSTWCPTPEQRASLADEPSLTLSAEESAMVNTTELHEFTRMVREMRMTQRQARSRDDIDAMANLERRVDARILEILRPSVATGTVAP